MEIQGYRISIGSRHHPNGQESYININQLVKCLIVHTQKELDAEKLQSQKGNQKHLMIVLNTTLSTLQEIPARKQWKPKVQSDILASSGPKRGSKSLALHPGIDSSETQWDERWHLRWDVAYNWEKVMSRKVSAFLDKGTSKGIDEPCYYG